MELSGCTQSEVAERVGRDRSTVANTVRLLDLPVEVQDMLADGRLSAGHGRALLAFGSADAMRLGAEKAASKGLSVRELEALGRVKKQRKKMPRKARTEDPILRDWEERLQRTLGTQVRIERMGTEGTIRIEYYSDEDLERILETLGTLG
jgi:ParB family chromosome partitioning protein